MAVDVQHRDARGALRAQPLRRQGRVVDVAMPAGAARVGVMPGRARQRIRAASRRRLVRRRQRAAGGGHRAVPGLRRHRAGRIGGEPPRLPDDGGRRLRPIRQHLRRGMTVRHDLRPVILQPRPRLEPVFEKVEIGGAVHALQRRRLGRGWGGDFQLHPRARRQQRLGARRDLEVPPHLAALQKEQRRVRQLYRIPEGLHRSDGSALPRHPILRRVRHRVKAAVPP